MKDIAICVDKLSKRYRIGARQKREATLRKRLVNMLASPFEYLRASLRPPTEDETLWALRDVSFEVQHGEVLGIIGRNGAGKSTLLKILSRITEPTSGTAALYGRVGSLLEVGTGFHPELTGRENIYMNGAILGMRRAEIDAKFDEIVDFAGVEKFIDTPVKRYSSGMYVRLGFAVAAHLEPEILIVDEVLAVGDAEFQKKCLGKMGEVAKGGRTVLFVSHNITAVRNLCGQTLLLDQGEMQEFGDTYAVTEAYLRKSLRADSLGDISELIQKLPPDPVFQLLDIEITQDGLSGNVVVNGKPMEIRIHYRVLETTAGFRVLFDLLDDHQDILIRSFHDEHANSITTTEKGEYVSKAVIPANLLAPRTYELRILATIFNIRSCVGDGIGIPLYVEPTSGINRGYAIEPIRSKLQPQIAWETRHSDRFERVGA